MVEGSDGTLPPFEVGGGVNVLGLRELGIGWRGLKYPSTMGGYCKRTEPVGVAVVNCVLEGWRGLPRGAGGGVEG